MIVYNVKRRWFTMKNDAEAYRKAEGLPPSGTYTLRIESRDDLAALLNGLCGIDGIHRYVEVVEEPVPEEVLARNEITNNPPDCVPLFLVKDWEQRMKGIYK
ncbi:hypothetical protein [Mesorhizobium sp. M1252]|uniref:hypothetical protein n=1 Tax=Mesorhizobium sp. M1252 TaxID=2957073 RepID=UPI003336FDCD